MLTSGWRRQGTSSSWKTLVRSTNKRQRKRTRISKRRWTAQTNGRSRRRTLAPGAVDLSARAVSRASCCLNLILHLRLAQAFFRCTEAPSSPRTSHKERCVLSRTRVSICQCVSYVFRSVMGSWLRLFPVRRSFYYHPPTPKAQHSTCMITTQYTSQDTRQLHTESVGQV